MRFRRLQARIHAAKATQAPEVGTATRESQKSGTENDPVDEKRPRQ